MLKVTVEPLCPEVIVRLIWHSNAPWNSSAYGKETALFIPRIEAAGHEIAAIAAPYTFSGSILEWNGIPVLPCARDSAGCDTIVSSHEYFKADLTITLADPFGLLKAAETLSQINVAHWFPVDCHPLGRGDVTLLREGHGIPIAMSRFGEGILRDEGTDPLYVPHGVDTGIYKPGDRTAYRETVNEIDNDTFVIGLIAMNRDPSRKGIQEQFLAFAEFHKRHPDSFLAIHSAPAGGLNLTAMAARLGVSAAVGYPDTYSYDLGMITEEQIATWYQGLDILSLCSYGEGFGLPLIEAQACGIPVVTTDASATAELCGGGWLVSGTDFWTDGHQSYWTRPDVADIAAAYEAAWEAREDGSLGQIRKSAYEFAQQYAADRVSEVYWKPVLAELENRIG
jgi:glycosyltransferase involved in cell wall biosynthesis